MIRLTRSEQVAKSRTEVLAAAGRLFRERGFHGATLEEIADAAGFSKGVIYSRFGSKDDLFLALLEEYVGKRGESVGQRLDKARDGAEFQAVWEQARADRRADLAWELLILEFRVHAARDPELRRRFASIHLRRLEAGAEVFERLASRVGRSLPYDALDFARFISALDSGGVLEEFVEGPGPAFELSRDAVLKLLGPPVE